MSPCCALDPQDFLFSDLQMSAFDTCLPCWRSHSVSPRAPSWRAQVLPPNGRLVEALQPFLKPPPQFSQGVTGGRGCEPAEGGFPDSQGHGGPPTLPPLSAPAPPSRGRGLSPPGPGGSLVQPSREAVGAPSAQRRILKQAPRTGCVVPATAHGLSHGALSRAPRPSPALPALQFARSLHPKPAVTLVR